MGEPLYLHEFFKYSIILSVGYLDFLDNIFILVIHIAAIVLVIYSIGNQCEIVWHTH